MKTLFTRLFITATFASSVAFGCAPLDDEDGLEVSEVDIEAEGADDETDPDVEQLDPQNDIIFAAQEPEPSAAAPPCPTAFCFWTETGFWGNRITAGPGDFSISFPVAVRSAYKRNNTYRVKVWSEPNFTGSCAVLGPNGGEGQWSQLFKVRSARRMEPNAPGCP